MLFGCFLDCELLSLKFKINDVFYFKFSHLPKILKNLEIIKSLYHIQYLNP